MDDNKHSEMLKDFKESVESGYFDAYFEKERIKNQIHEGRLKKLYQYSKLPGKFEALMQRLIKQHGGGYDVKCMREGCEPYPNHLLELVFSAANTYGVKACPGTWADCVFDTDIHKWNGYYFVHMHGQGTASFVLNGDEERIISL